MNPILNSDYTKKNINQDNETLQRETTTKATNQNNTNNIFADKIKVSGSVRDLNIGRIKGSMYYLYC